MLKIRKIRVLVAALPMLILLAAQVCAQDKSDMILQRGSDGKALRFESAAKPETASAATTDTASSLRMAGIWLVLIGAAGAGMVYMRKRQKLIGGTTIPTTRLAVLERLPIGPSRELLLIKACDRILVVSSLANQMSLLSDLPCEESVSQPFAGVLKSRNDEAPTSSRELRQSPAPRVHFAINPEIQSPLPVRNETRKSPIIPSSMPAWPDMDTAR